LWPADGKVVSVSSSGIGITAFSADAADRICSTRFI
jgi:hypothetical protein